MIESASATGAPGAAVGVQLGQLIGDLLVEVADLRLELLDVLQDVGLPGLVQLLLPEGEVADGLVGEGVGDAHRFLGVLLLGREAQRAGLGVLLDGELGRERRRRAVVPELLGDEPRDLTGRGEHGDLGERDRADQRLARVPFSQLRFPAVADSTFGLAIVREIGRLNETTTWPLLAKSATGFVSSFGELTGLQIGRAQKRLELVPYVVGDVKSQPVDDANPLQDARTAGAEVGVDLEYAMKPSLTLTATVNPDFGQVEADPAVVNLSAFETFFSERRPFFVEGGGIFEFNVDCSDGGCSGLFYSRRIGRAPRGSPSLGEGEFSDAPAQTTILGAGEADRACRRVLDRRAQRDHSRRGRGDCSDRLGAPRDGGAADRLFR